MQKQPKPKPPAAKKPAAKVQRGNHLKAEMFGFFGSTGSGKTYALKQEFKKLDKRQTIAWSPKEEVDDFAGFLKCRAYVQTPQAFLEFIKAARAGHDAVFVPFLSGDEKRFDLFCRLAMELAPINMLVPELHTVTKPQGGTVNWSNANLIGRARGLRILADSQRPSGVDKDFFGGLTFAWCGRQNYLEDAKTTARLVLATPEQILALPDHQGLTRRM